MKFLIDECLSPELAKRAEAAGHAGSSHIAWLGRSGATDWELKPFILTGEWTFVTRNAIDFRGPAARPGSSGQYADVALHAGLVCLAGPKGMDLEMQLDLFDEALSELSRAADLVNQVLEISIDTDDQITILRYELPSAS
ncbi:DUF5615 family PIN-like protein [soil metagenome]